MIYRTNVLRKKYRASRERGFTFIELVVTIFIMSLLTAALTANTRIYERQSTLRNIADQVSLMFRQAQVFAVGVREAPQGSGEFDSGYGIFVTMSMPERVILYVDKNDNKVYDPGNDCGSGATECLEEYELPGGYEVAALCGGASAAVLNCSLTELTVNFPVQSHEAVVWDQDDNTHIAGKIELVSSAEDKNAVYILSSGLTYVE